MGAPLRGAVPLDDPAGRESELVVQPRTVARSDSSLAGASGTPSTALGLIRMWDGRNGINYVSRTGQKPEIYLVTFNDHLSLALSSIRQAIDWRMVLVEPDGGSAETSVAHSW